MEPKHGVAPILIDEVPGKKAYCQCDLSANLPYCDGAHSQHHTGIAPIVCEIDAPGEKAVCQCHRTATPPWCDGTHGKPA